MQGNVVWFNEKKGYGFIRPSEGQKDVFVHISGIKKDDRTKLSDGQLVNFDLVEGEKGKQAINVKKTGG